MLFSGDLMRANRVRFSMALSVVTSNWQGFFDGPKYIPLEVYSQRNILDTYTISEVYKWHG
jgi:hypothetical protein